MLPSIGIKNKTFLKVSCFILLSFFLFFPEERVWAGKKNPGPEELYKQARQAFYSFKNSGNSSKDRRGWIKIGALFQKVYKNFPNSHRSDDAVYTLARIYLDLFKKHRNRKDLDQSLHFFRKVTTDYPASRLADDAQFKIAEIYQKIKKTPEQALKAYEKIPALYPEGDKLNEASKIIASLEKKVPKKFKNGGEERVKVKDIRHWSNRTYTRVVIDLTESLEFKEKRLREPDRLYVDLYNAVIPENLRNHMISVDDSLLKRIRASQYRSDVVRVVFDVKNFSAFEVFLYENPFRVVIDIRGKSSGKINKTESVPRAPPKKSSRKRETGAEKFAIKRIVIDPGHGGKDRGATGYKGIKEKDIVLDIALRLKRILLSKMVGKVILTREKDVYIPLEERTAIANTSNGDIFISIHGNSAPRKDAYGIETYYLSNALSERALDTALRENMVPTKDMSDDLLFILSDMLANSNMKESSELAGIMQKSLLQGLKKTYSKIKDLGAKGGPFYVLHGANMPSILVEVGFLSNPTEAKRIKSSKYREKVAYFLYQGIKQYMQNTQHAFKSR